MPRSKYLYKFNDAADKVATLSGQLSDVSESFYGGLMGWSVGEWTNRDYQRLLSRARTIETLARRLNINVERMQNAAERYRKARY